MRVFQLAPAQRLTHVFGQAGIFDMHSAVYNARESVNYALPLLPLQICNSCSRTCCSCLVHNISRKGRRELVNELWATVVQSYLSKSKHTKS